MTIPRSPAVAISHFAASASSRAPARFREPLYPDLEVDTTEQNSEVEAEAVADELSNQSNSVLLHRLLINMKARLVSLEHRLSENSATSSQVKKEEPRSDSHANSHTSGPTTPLPHSVKDPKVPTSSEFSDKISEFGNFIAQCSLTFTMCPNTYVRDEQKVLFVISLLRGTALT